MGLFLLKGIIPAVVLPMDSKFQPDLDEYVRYLKWVKSAGVTGVAVNVDTGEGPTLTAEERQVVTSAAKKALGSDLMLVSGILGSSTDSAVKCAREAKQSGADAGLVFPNSAFFGYPLEPEMPVEYHRRISVDADLKIILFQLQPALGGVEFSSKTLLELSKIPGTIAIKEALFDAKKFVDTLRLFRDSAPNVSFLTGNDNFIFESFVLGCDGALIGFGTPPTRDLVKMFDLVQEGRVKEASEIRERVQPLADVIYGSPVRNYRARTKYALSAMGVISEKSTYMRPPLMSISEAEKYAVKDALKKAELL